MTKVWNIPCTFQEPQFLDRGASVFNHRVGFCSRSPHRTDSYRWLKKNPAVAKKTEPKNTTRVAQLWRLGADFTREQVIRTPRLGGAIWSDCASTHVGKPRVRSKKNARSERPAQCYHGFILYTRGALTSLARWDESPSHSHSWRE